MFHPGSLRYEEEKKKCYMVVSFGCGTVGRCKPRLCDECVSSSFLEYMVRAVAASREYLAFSPAILV